VTTIDWPPPKPARGRRGRIVAIALAFFVLLSAGTALSYYVDSLWFDSLGFSDVFWTALNQRATVFSVFTFATFVVL